MVKPNDTLLAVLREELALIGPKGGCRVGECAACTVLKDGRPILPCLILDIDVAGTRITTIEGLPIGEDLDALHEVFVHREAVQYGFAIPRMLLAARKLLGTVRNPRLIK